MVSQNRILTVSYGTFSCTLEGFDDPFGTMKAIAEYFRDLAAEDRYFGAEPPQPDAAMLHRIAEREIQRRVEAKIQDNGNGVILRAAEAERPHPVARPLAMPEPVAEAARAPDPVPAPVVPPVAVAPVLVEPAPRLRPVDDGVAAKLARIRAAVDRSRVSQDDDDAEDMPPAPRAVVPLPADLIEDLPEDLPEAAAPMADLDVPETVSFDMPGDMADSLAVADVAANAPAAFATAAPAPAPEASELQAPLGSSSTSSWHGLHSLRFVQLTCRPQNTTRNQELEPWRVFRVRTGNEDPTFAISADRLRR